MRLTSVNGRTMSQFATSFTLFTLVVSLSIYCSKGCSRNTKELRVTDPVEGKELITKPDGWHEEQKSEPLDRKEGVEIEIELLDESKIFDVQETYDIHQQTEELSDNASVDLADFQYSYQPEGLCGMQSYSWLQPNQVGQLVQFKELVIYHLKPEFIELILSQAGYPDIVPVTYGTVVYSFRYTTQDRGELREATALLGFPDIQEPLVFPTLLWLHGTTGFSDSCAPSLSEAGPAAAVLGATMGFVTVAPDFLGMCGLGEPCEDMFHPYLIGEPTAIASWDSVRAAYRLLDQISASAKPDFRVAIWGVSQGGHATLFAHRYAPIYAPEFEVPCAIAAVPPSNLAAQAANAFQKKGGAAALGTAFLLAAYRWYEVQTPLDSIFNAHGPKNYAEWIPQVFDSSCSAGKFFEGADSLEDVFNPEFLNAIKNGELETEQPWGCIGQENSLPTTSVPFILDSPILFIIGENDSLVDEQTERESFQTLCNQGYNLSLIDCAGASHGGAVEQTMDRQILWLLDCLQQFPQGIEDLCVLKDKENCSEP